MQRMSEQLQAAPFPVHSLVLPTVQPVPTQKPPEHRPSTQPQPSAEQAVRRAAVQPSPAQKAPPQFPLSQPQPKVPPHSRMRGSVQPSCGHKPSLHFAQGAPTLTHT